MRIPSIGAPASPDQWCYWQGHPVARYILGVPPLTGMADAQLINWLRPMLAHYLTDPAP